jgi:hypothetical protein
MKLACKVLGLALFADGVGALIFPRKYLENLETGTPLIDDVLDAFANNPRLTQSVAVLEATLGLWLTVR